MKSLEGWGGLTKALALVAVMGLASCASITNPINNNTEASAESAYIAAAGAETAYLALSFCAPGTSFTIAKPCKETAIIHKVKAYDQVAYTALLQVRAFQKANPGDTVSINNLATSAIAAAQTISAAIPKGT